MKNLLYAIGMIIGGAVLLVFVLSVEIIQEIKWRFDNAKTN